MLGLSRKIFKTVLKNELLAVRTHYINTQTTQINPLQKIALEERCILVNELDRPVGEASKMHCHKISKDGSIPLHRAFSVFLFNSQGDLLLQKRSLHKITFPDHYTNTCCSHPLAEITGESDETNAIGVKRAAQRRLNYELGIPTEEVPPEAFNYLTRIHYQAAGDKVWGEHEIDYVLFLQVEKVTLDPNLDEVSEIQWISKDDIDNFVRSLKSPLTPWFKLILKNQLPLWWNNLNQIDKFQDHMTIHRFKDS